MPKANVLLVEDEPDLRETLQEVLEEEGYAVTTAKHGREAIEHLRRLPLPAIVLLDLMMPIMDGGSFLAWLSSQPPPLAELPVLLLTAGGEAMIDAARHVREPVAIIRK